MVIESIEWMKFRRVETAGEEEGKGQGHLTHPRELWGRLNDTVCMKILSMLPIVFFLTSFSWFTQFKSTWLTANIVYDSHSYMYI